MKYADQATWFYSNLKKSNDLKVRLKNGEFITRISMIDSLIGNLDEIKHKLRCLKKYYIPEKDGFQLPQPNKKERNYNGIFKE